MILKRLHETVDGEFQKYAATDGRFNREHFFNKYPELQGRSSRTCPTTTSTACAAAATTR